MVLGSGLCRVDGPGRQVLLRDAGGLTPGQTVYSNAGLRVEFGPERPAGAAAPLTPAAVLRCVTFHRAVQKKAAGDSAAGACLRAHKTTRLRIALKKRTTGRAG
jgi:hypothetical protein